MPADELSLIVGIVKHIRANRGACCEDIAAAVNRPFSVISAYLTMLESDGLICTDLLGRCSINVRIV